MRYRDPKDEEIGKRVRALRLQRGMSQTALAQPLEVTFQQVQKYENGANRISAGRLQRIADLFNVSVVFFYGDSAPRKSHREPDFDLFQTDDVLRIARAYIRIKDRKVRTGILNLAQELASGPMRGP